MKKILIVIVCLIIMFFNYQASFASEPMEAVVLSVTDKLTVLVGDESSQMLNIYDLVLVTSCSPSNFQSMDLLTIEALNSQTPSVNDIISNKISFNNLLDEPVSLNNCQIIQVTRVSQGYVNMYVGADLEKSNYALEGIDGQNYFLADQSSCLQQVNSKLAIFFSSQKSKDTLASADLFIYGMTYDIIKNSYQIHKLNNCPAGLVTKVKTHAAEHLETTIINRLLKVEDNETGAVISLEVDTSCGLLYQSDFITGEITYLDENQALIKPVYVSFINNENFSSLNNFDQITDDSICRVINYQIISQPLPFLDEDLYQRPTEYINIPPLTNYYLGPRGKKIYTDRPDSSLLIGAIVKGETDPATYIVDIDGSLRWIKSEAAAARLFGPDWDNQIIWFSDSIVYTYDFGDDIEH